MHREMPSPRGACPVAPARGSMCAAREQVAQTVGCGRWGWMWCGVVFSSSLPCFWGCGVSVVTPVTERSVGRGVLCVVSAVRGQPAKGNRELELHLETA